MRRRFVMVVGLAAFASPAFVFPVAAQSALDGPLAAPDAPAATPAHRAKAAKVAKGKPKRAKHVAAAPAAAAPSAAAVPSRTPGGAPAAKSAPDDPLSLGMKWNGSNDTAAQTRYQNLNGNAVGTGAEVGLKLHF